jgi:hypothetical protein
VLKLALKYDPDCEYDADLISRFASHVISSWTEQPLEENVLTLGKWGRKWGRWGRPRREEKRRELLRAYEIQQFVQRKWDEFIDCLMDVP